MADINNRSRRGSNLTHDWSTRKTMDDNFRKSPARESNSTKISSDYCCDGEERASRRYEATTKSMCHRQGDTTSDHQLYKLEEEKITDEEGSMTETETIDNGHGDVRPTCHQCDAYPKKYDNSSREYSSCTYGKFPASSNRPNKTENLVVENANITESVANCRGSLLPNRNQRIFGNYANRANLPQALHAMRKLEYLKELQRRREQAERYYSHEIRRLIGENFFAENAAIVTAPTKNNERIGSPATRKNDDGLEQRTRGGGFSKEMEPYGTMTTITRFDCGCVEETTIPIFSSTVGHVKKCESHRYQERPVSKLLTTSHPQELSYRIGENMGKIDNHVNTCHTPRIRGKNLTDCVQYRNLSNSVSRDLESRDDRKVQTRNRRSPRNLSPVRTNSPVRKYSDTSSN